jgi:hypothetical protein
LLCCVAFQLYVRGSPVEFPSTSRLLAASLARLWTVLWALESKDSRRIKKRPIPSSTNIAPIARALKTVSLQRMDTAPISL